MKKFTTFKSFVKYLGLSYFSLYNNKYKEIGSLLKEAKENFEKENRFQCDETKLIKILSFLKKTKNCSVYTAKSIEMLCLYTSEKNYENVEPVNIDEFDINLEFLKKTKRRILLYKKDKCRFLLFLLDALIINYERIQSVLSDNSLTLDKLKYIPEEEFRYILKNNLALLKIIKKVLKESLKKLKEKTDAEKS